MKKIILRLFRPYCRNCAWSVGVFDSSDSARRSAIFHAMASTGALRHRVAIDTDERTR